MLNIEDVILMPILQEAFAIMDTLAHAVYGATLFSRTGLAGGRRGPVDAQGRRIVSDWTFWAAFGFGLLPDIFSIGIYFIQSALNWSGISFHALPDYVFTLYQPTHSLVVAFIGLGLIRLFFKPLLLPALAWPFHIFLDIFTHSLGPFQTPFLYPLSDLAFNGIRWWMHPWFVRAYWGVLVLIWLGIVMARRRCTSKAESCIG